MIRDLFLPPMCLVNYQRGYISTYFYIWNIMPVAYNGPKMKH